MLCPSCHTKNRDNAKFCKGCGMSFPPETVEETPSEAQGASLPVASGDQPLPAATEQASPIVKDEPVVEDVGDLDDPSLAPTQILTPEQMIAYHTRRWQQELEREQHESTHASSTMDIADMPTLLFSPADSASFASSATQERSDIWSQPTVIIEPHAAEPRTATPDMPVTPATIKETEVAKDAVDEDVQKDEAASKDVAAIESSITATEAASTPEAASPSPREEEEMDQATEPTDDQEKTVPTFPVLAVGATVGGRYEVTQVMSEAEDEHIYQVVDHQGYQLCWNCGSQQNAEGDEFCIDCGAELLNAPYSMHEYPAAANGSNDSHVIAGSIMNTFVDQGHTYVVEQPQAAQIAFPNGVHLLASCDSDAGDVRRSEPNEDSVFMLMLERVHESVASPAGVFVVADGMGGHDDGQGASRMTVSTIAERIVRDLLMPPLKSENAGEQTQALDEDALVELVHGAIQDANTALCQSNQRDKTDKGSTLTGFMIAGDLAYIFNVGDSRTYMQRDGKLYQLTTDHSLVGQLVAGGLIEPDDVYTHPQRSQIYRSIGDKLNVQIDIFKQQIHPGDVLLSCSDGLWEMVRNPQITEILTNAPDPQTACAHLIEAANTNGGEDNVSAVIVFVR